MTPTDNIFRYFKHIACAVITVAALGACSSSRNAASTPDLPIGGARPGTRQHDTPVLNAVYSDWQSFYAPFTLNMNKPSSLTVSGRATMNYDQATNLSLRVLGFEVAVMYMDHDSVFVADKVHKYLAAAPMSAVTDRTGLTLADLQCLLLGRMVYPGRGTVPASGIDKLFSRSQSVGGTVLTPRKGIKGIDWTYTLTDGSLAGLSVAPGVIEPVVFKFADFVTSPSGTVAQEVAVDARIRTKQVDASLSWSMDRAEWNSQRTAQRPTFRGYTRIGADALLNALKSM